MNNLNFFSSSFLGTSLTACLCFNSCSSIEDPLQIGEEAQKMDFLKIPFKPLSENIIQNPEFRSTSVNKLDNLGMGYKAFCILLRQQVIRHFW